jgi:transposase InsO family protein
MGIEDRSEVSALVVHKNNSQETTASRSSNSLSRFCTYCNKNSHTEDICWKKHGYPEWYKLKQAERKSKKSAQVASIDNPTSVFHVTRASPKEGNSGLAFISAATNTWVIDSGATDHMTSYSSLIDSLIPSPIKSVQVANGTPMPISGYGNVSLSSSLPLSSVLHAPNLSNNLLSISKITKNLNCSVTFHSSHCVFQDNLTKMTIGVGRERGGLYYLEGAEGLQQKKDQVLQVTQESSDRLKLLLWHCRLGHPSFSYLERLFPQLFKKVHVSSLRCEHCIYAKNHRVPFKISINKSPFPFTRVFTDVWGPFSTPSTLGYRYFVSFIDDCTRVSWVYLLKSKHEVLDVIPKFSKMIITQFNTQVKVFHSDNGREFKNQSLAKFFEENGILHQTSCTYTPQQNGTAERKNRHILEVARALCFAMHVPKRFWADAVMTATFLINRMPARAIDYQTPFRMLSQFYSIPSALNICPRVFGCVCYIHVHSHQRDKLDPRALKCVFLGYSDSQKGYKCYHPPTMKYFVTMDVQFCERESYFSGGVSLSPLQMEIDSKEEDKLWLDEKRFWNLGGQGDPMKDTIDGQGEPMEDIIDGQEEPVVHDIVDSQGELEEELIDDLEKSINSPEPIATELQTSERERPDSLFKKCYTRKNKAVHPNAPLNDMNTPLDDTTTPTDDSSETNLEVHSSLPILSSENFISGSQVINQDRRYPSRDRRPPDRFGFSPENVGSSNCVYPISDYVSYHRLTKTHLSFALQLSSMPIPSHFQEALENPKWKSAMVDEMTALQKNSTWEMVELPKDKKTVGCKWVFSVKYKSDGTIDRYKARLVAKGYTQTYGIDYQETFAPVAKMSTVRVILSLAVNLDWPLRQLDVKNAFLHGDLLEEVYMDPPPGFTPKGGKVCKLKKALYGLKQSPRAWFGRFSHSMKKYGFKQAMADHTLFYKRVGTDITLLIVYVDDMIVTGSNLHEIGELRDYLAKEFEMKDLGDLKYFLGIEVSRSKQELFLSQRKYTLDLLAETGNSACQPVDTPIEVNHGLSIYPDQIPTNKERYQRMVGKLIYLTHTRPDISYAVSVVSQFMHNPSEQHMSAVNRILAYLKSSPGKGILFSRHGHLDIVGYTDSDFAGSKLDRKSTSGYLSFVGGNLVTWRSKKQKVVSLSSAEAEYRALHHATTELTWLNILLTELGFGSEKPMTLFCDNTAAIEIANNPVQHDRTKHVELDRNYIKDNLDTGKIKVPYIKSADQLADMMTHAVHSSPFHSVLSKLGMSDIYAPT